MGRFDGKIALITGASSGIGLATAQLLVNEGAFVFITGRRQLALDEAVQLIGSNARGIQGDIGNLDDLERLFQIIGEDKGRLDMVFANAAVQASAPLGLIELAQYNHIFDTNVRGTLLTVQGALPLLSDGASIVLTASVAASKGNPARSVYGASKAAIRSFARSWANDLKPRAIRVNALSPGPTDTGAFKAPGMDLEQVAQIKSRMAAAIPLGRLARVEEIAKAAVFLLSEDSSFVTGSELFVDGGMLQI
ncbi:SDR family oxidoreductase [Pseudomonas sp. 10B1]|uniref:SDR family NAD(P)-dependent oxidoreductase n=1 Tax=unclassified Pseudomonas TaxID=196821 RepID=UPI002AB428DB|nr:MULTISPECIES: SDR family oxidoreductase [unclassified Pseudomonas]MDY7562580.1 SDR family oxidoreductase [Pseudomonas sp. AB6]MEA9979651.1 SDR family oxidoreductase [Pseudomonas sp. RTS4]MEA9997313.1 SDR family oxidoreductase [Pseudomonas sp. AA4]MEB0086508.1 SDR family oxidoreductase [Pseudomonas sp. RTI1]MEB0128509.1 SDR family oxidoreductase [Pseudomonas sp. CCC1.2]